jgi:GNAT superfamily N-acetyltransferase
MAGDIDMKNIKITGENIFSADAQMLIDELSETLQQITGSDGRSNFYYQDMADRRAFFAVSRDESGRPIGCGALRRLSDEDAEIKRLYARPNDFGAGTQMLHFLENKARELGFFRVCLQTRKINRNAVHFYQKNGYDIIPNYGIYENNSAGVCFAKSLVSHSAEIF